MYWFWITNAKICNGRKKSFILATYHLKPIKRARRSRQMQITNLTIKGGFDILKVSCFFFCDAEYGDSGVGNIYCSAPNNIKFDEWTKI